MRVRRLAPSLLAVVAALGVTAAAAFAIGRPDLGQARGFLAGAYPTAAGLTASLAVLLWLLLAAGLVAASVQAVRAAAGSIPRTTAARRLAAALLGIGLLALLGGALVHLERASVEISGGSPAEAYGAAARLEVR